MRYQSLSFVQSRFYSVGDCQLLEMENCWVVAIFICVFLLLQLLWRSRIIIICRLVVIRSLFGRYFFYQ